MKTNSMFLEATEQRGMNPARGCSASAARRHDFGCRVFDCRFCARATADAERPRSGPGGRGSTLSGPWMTLLLFASLTNGFAATATQAEVGEKVGRELPSLEQFYRWMLPPSSPFTR